MRVLVAGATGAIGRPLLPMLTEAGHEVVGTTRTPGNLDAIARTGAEPVVMDALDADAVMRAVVDAKPDAIIHQLSSLKEMRDFKRLDKEFATTNRLRVEGTTNLLAAARAAGAKRFIAQSFTGPPNPRTGRPVKTEDDGLDPDPVPASRQTVDAIRHVEQVVPAETSLVGIVLRYGAFYGPGTGISRNGDMVQMVHKRKFPVVGKGTGVWSLIHIDDAARATVQALEHGTPGLYNIVDDDPAPVSAVLPALAGAVGAKPPRHVPAWLAKLLVGDYGISVMTQIRGSSNAKAKRELDWQLRYPTWREGFRTGLG
jgi:nucleoside-diphosphate-sugar epimerase